MKLVSGLVDEAAAVILVSYILLTGPSIPTTVQGKGFQGRMLVYPQHKDNIDSYMELGGAARNMGVKPIFSGIFGGEKPSYCGFRDHCGLWKL